MKLRRSIWLLPSLLLAAEIASATVFDKVTDRQLVDRSDAVVIGLVRDVLSRQTSDGLIVTDSHLIVEDALKGTVPDTLTVTEIGGVVGTQFTMVADSATYAPGERVLVFLRRRDDGTFFTTSMALGKFTFAKSARGEAVVVRQASELGDERPRLEGAFEGFIRDVARGEATTARYLSASTTSRLPIAPNGTAKQYALIDPNNLPVRWPTSTVTFHISGSLGFPTSTGISNGMNAWTNDPASNINLLNGGSSASIAPAVDSSNVIYLGYSGAVTGVCDGSQGCTLLSGSSSHTFDGDTWDSISDADIVIRPSVIAAQFDALMTHELGHSIGIRHSDQGTPSSSAAIMASFVPAIYGSTLQQWDKDAVDSLYGAGPVCQPAQISSVSGGGTVTSGTSVLLSVSATGTAPLTYQWYDGQSGDTSMPVGTNSPQFNTPPITTTKNYWVKVTNACNISGADSMTITITPQACQKPVITVDLQNQTIASGGTASLIIGNTGTAPLAYQWYQGQSGDISNPIMGANSNQFTTPPLTQNTSYWVRVSNPCGSADSKTATITIIGMCDKPTFIVQPKAGVIKPGKPTFLVAVATTTSYQWYKGTAPDTSTPVNGQKPSNERWVNQIYVDLLGRVADAGAISTLTGALAGSTRPAVALSLLTSDEYRKNLVSSFYSTLLHRGATANEIAFWLSAFSANLTDEQVEAQFLGSGEYFALAGGTNEEWVNHLFLDVLGRPPTGDELLIFTSNLKSITSYAFLANYLLSSDEARTLLVNGYYAAFLRRSPEATELSFFIGLLKAGKKDEEVIAAIVGSDEYFNFPTILVTDPVSGPGLSYWVKASNDCGPTNSSTITLQLPPCVPPVIVKQLGANISVGKGVSLSVFVAGAVSYQWYQGTSGDTSKPVPGATSPVLTLPPLLTVGTVYYWVKASNACGSTNSQTLDVIVLCAAPGINISVPPTSPHSSAYTVSWTGNSQVSNKYELQEATSSDFTQDLTTFTISDGTTSKVIAAHSTINKDTRFYYRVRGFAVCDGGKNPSAYSGYGSTLVTVPAPARSPYFGLSSSPCGQQKTCTITQKLFIGGFSKTGKDALDANDTFSVASDKPFITITPSNGPLPADGATVTLTIDTSNLDIGSSEATVAVSKVSASSKGVLGTTTVNVPVSVSLVAPVTPLPKDANAPPNTVLVPAIAHAEGINSQFQSDVRITNTSNQPITYQLTYTPSNTDGTQSGKQSSITVDAGETKALNDIVKNWYGSGTLGEAGIGTLEIRPLNYAGKTGVNVSFATVAASRTYNTTANGTFGQYIPAIPLIDFLAKSDVSKISLQQVAQSTAYRTNLGFVEGAGQPVDFVATLLDDKNNAIATRSYSLKPFEYQQISLPGFFPGAAVTDGRIEVKVTSDSGRLTAYASVLDNITSDPLLVFPVDPSQITASRFVVPGVAELNNGAANFHTDMRVYNGSASSTNVTLTFPANSALQPVTKQLAANEVWAVDNVLPTLWNTTGGGAVVATTDNGAPLVVTARTFSQRDDGGTFGQFIPGVTAADAVGMGDRPLQVVQLEQSPAFRSNLGLVEVTGSPVTLDVAAYVPESKVAAHTTVTLAPGQFTQLGSVFAGMGFTSNVYNGRIAVTAIGGTGRAAAYGSVVDNRTQDGTYVPAK